jgi:hypothetical protein
MAKVRVQWLKNHGVRVVTEGPEGRTERFVPADGMVLLSHAAVALGTYPVKIRRLIERKRLKAERDPFSGALVVPVSELRRLRRDRTELGDQRKRREVGA